MSKYEKPKTEKVKLRMEESVLVTCKTVGEIGPMGQDCYVPMEMCLEIYPKEGCGPYSDCHGGT